MKAVRWSCDLAPDFCDPPPMSRRLLLIWIKRAGRRWANVCRHPLGNGGSLVLFEPNEPDNRPPIHSKAYERGTGLLFFLGAAAALLAVIYLLSFLGD